MQAGSSLKIYLIRCRFVNFLTYFCRRRPDLSTFFSSIVSMFHSHPLTKKSTLLFSLLFTFFSIKISAQDGQALFQSRCASCHHPLKAGTGPALKDLESRGKWADHNEILKWVHNPAGYMAEDPYTQGLKDPIRFHDGG